MSFFPRSSFYNDDLHVLLLDGEAITDTNKRLQVAFPCCCAMI